MVSSRKKMIIPFCGVAISVFLALLIVAVGYLFVSSLTADLHRQSDADISTVVTVPEGSSAEYVLIDSDSRYYSREELNQLSSWDLYIANNEVYARHGRGFNRDDLKEHFSACSWYRQLYSPEEYDAKPSQFNDFEKANVELIGELRRERDDPYL